MMLLWVVISEARWGYKEWHATDRGMVRVKWFRLGAKLFFSKGNNESRDSEPGIVEILSTGLWATRIPKLPSRFVIRTNPPLTKFTLHKNVLFLHIIFYMCFFYCSDSSYLLWHISMYHPSCIFIVLNRGYDAAFCMLLCYDRCWIKTMTFCKILAGSEDYLYHVLSTFVDSEHEITILLSLAV